MIFRRFELPLTPAALPCSGCPAHGGKPVTYSRSFLTSLRRASLPHSPASPCGLALEPGYFACGCPLTSTATILRLPLFSVRFPPHPPAASSSKLPCENSASMLSTVRRNSFRPILLSLRSAVSETAPAHLHRTPLSRLTLSCESANHSTAGRKRTLAASLQIFLRRPAASAVRRLLRGEETALPEKNLSTSWDRFVSDIAIIDSPCTGALNNTD